MASRKLFIAVFLLAGITNLWAQTTGYYMELRFIQRLTWRGDEYAMRYEVIIEKEEAENFRWFLLEFTETNFIEVSLSPGKYRCQVIPHDFFDQPIPVTEWVEFEVRPGNEQLTTGELEIFLVNPAEPENRTEIFFADHETVTLVETEKITEYINRFDIYIGASWIPLLPLYEENQFFGANNSFLGISVRLCAVSARQNLLNMGIELAVSWRIYESGVEQTVQSTEFDLNILAQSRFPGGRTALNFRLGAGVSLLSDIPTVSAIGQYSIHINIGASFLWLILRNLFMETGAEFSQSFTEDSFGFFRPWIGLGYRF